MRIQVKAELISYDYGQLTYSGSYKNPGHTGYGYVQAQVDKYAFSKYAAYPKSVTVIVEAPDEHPHPTE